MWTAEKRRALWERDGGICGICGEPVPLAEMEIDHIMPRRERGSNSLANLRATHGRCNRGRSRTSLADVPAEVLALPLERAYTIDIRAERLAPVRSNIGQMLASYRAQEPVVCVVCGQTVTKRRSTTQPTRYCGGTCRMRAYRERRAARPETP